MAKSNNPIPPGFHTLTPYLVVKGARKAIDFYKKAFNAEERLVMSAPDGRIMHSEIKIGDSDVDTVFNQAVKAGCTIRMPLANQFWGSRYGQVKDPFGHVWALSTHIEDVSPEDMKKRSEEACKQMASPTKNC